MPIARVAVALALIVAGMSPADAAPPPKTATPPKAAPRPLALEEILAFRGIEALSVSPDGRVAVVAVSETRLDENRTESDLYLVSLATGSPPRRLTTTAGRETSPRFSPDGGRLAYLARRGDEAKQVWVMPVSGGDGWPVTAEPAGVEGFAWAPDGKSIIYIGTPPLPPRERARRDAGDDAWVMGQQWRNQRLHFAPVPKKPSGTGPAAVSPATDGAWHVREDAAWSPDGRRVAWIATPTAEPDASEEARVQVMDVASGAVTDVPGSERASSFAWCGAPRGAGVLLFVRPFDGRGWSREDLYSWRPGQNLSNDRSAPVGLTASLDRDVEAVRCAPGGTEALVLYSRGAVHELARVPLPPGSAPSERGAGSAAPPRTIAKPGHPVDRFQPARDGWVYVRGDRPDEVWRSGPGATPQRLTRFNADLEESVALPRITTVTWQSDGQTLEGVLTTPEAAGVASTAGASGTPGAPARRPLLVRPHGGPRWHSMALFDPLNAHLAGRGYVIFEPNFRGSTGYGDAFAKANAADWGDGPFRDMMAGVDTLVDLGVADPERLSLYGWSYGGIVANWTATHTDRFRAIVSGAGVADFRLQYILSDARRWRFDYFGGSPFTGHRLAYEKDSPVNWVGVGSGGTSGNWVGVSGGGGSGAGGRGAGTPVLFIQGEVDERCPLQQALMMHRALLDVGRTSELVIYPREGHAFREPRHILDRARRVTAWIETHDAGPASQ